ncbi:hypothetical protein G0Q06_08710 [Puniceicoccales bacterium CK1056]|uniref:Uncharacterized protein n=1 Tax=Oceanipulchritudo coccoides TaxID=2706888 RepID=A0A6B2M2V7_9BACT|nr:hypothetical protein [Oceanipulchritudo coccoides]NDV62529.1 hypothetical protein [Oceanipulchritudo coccoides]
MGDLNFKQALCRHYNIGEDDYVSFVLARSLFKRVRIFLPFIQFFKPQYLFNERRLVEKVGMATTLREIQSEIDFYQHKHVVNFLWRDALRFRLSGMRLMSLATATPGIGRSKGSSAADTQASANP